MRGLTDEERAELIEAAGPDDGDYGHCWETDLDVPAFVVSLERRGLGVWVEAPEDDDYEVMFVATDMGHLALRVDTAARAAGVWP